MSLVVVHDVELSQHHELPPARALEPPAASSSCPRPHRADHHDPDPDAGLRHPATLPTASPLSVVLVVALWFFVRWFLSVCVMSSVDCALEPVGEIAVRLIISIVGTSRHDRDVEHHSFPPV